MTVGSQIDFVAHFLGKKIAYTYEIIKFTEDELVMRTAEGPFPMETTYLYKEVETNKTKMTLRNSGQPTGFSKWMAPLMRMMMRRANTKDLQKLKSLLENPA